MGILLRVLNQTLRANITEPQLSEMRRDQIYMMHAQAGAVTRLLLLA